MSLICRGMPEKSGVSKLFWTSGHPVGSQVSDLMIVPQHVMSAIFLQGGGEVKMIYNVTKWSINALLWVTFYINMSLRWLLLSPCLLIGWPFIYSLCKFCSWHISSVDHEPSSRPHLRNVFLTEVRAVGDSSWSWVRRAISSAVHFLNRRWNAGN